LGAYFLLVSILNITEVAHINVLIFSLGTNYELILTKIYLGNILGDFFTKSSGHPGIIQKQFIERSVLRNNFKNNASW
jgi:hypothetical protein